MMVVTFTIQEIVDVASPFIVRALACGLVPIVPVLATRVFVSHVMVSIAVLTVRGCVRGTCAVCFIVVRLCIFIVDTVIHECLISIRIVVYPVVSVRVISCIVLIISVVVAVVSVVLMVISTGVVAVIITIVITFI